MLQIRRVSKSSSSSSRIEFHRVRDNFTLRSRLLVWEIREGISSGAEFGEERSVVPKRALPSLRHTVSDSLNGDGMGCHPRRWDDESNKRANKSLKTFLLKLRGMYISGGGPTSNLNSFKVADPSKRDREGVRERRNSMRCRYRYLLKRVAKPGLDQVPVARKWKFSLGGEINSPLSLNDISWTDLGRRNLAALRITKRTIEGPSNRFGPASPSPRIIIPLAIIKTGERGRINWANYPPVGDEREDEEREREGKRKRKRFP